MKHLQVVHSQTMRIRPGEHILDISDISAEKRPFDGVKMIMRRLFGVVKLYLTPEEEQKERLLFAGGLLTVFIFATVGIALTNAVSFIQETRAEKSEMTALPGQLLDLVSSQRFGELPDVFLKVDSILQTIDAHVAPGRSTLHAEGSLLHDVTLLREASRFLMEAARESTPVMTAAVTFATDIHALTPENLRTKYGGLTSYMRLQWKTIMERVYPKVSLAAERIAQVRLEDFPKEYRETLGHYQAFTTDLRSLLERVDHHMPAILSLLGEDTPRTYAILLQNSGEMRATGGFIGSLAMVKLNDGWVEYLRFRDVYDIDGQIFENVPPPPGIETISTFFRLRDSNYWPDFPTSAKQVAWFLDKDKGPGVDGVFAITDTFVSRLLTLTGPVGFEGSNIPVTSENFNELMSFLVESKQDKKQPKSAVFAFSEVFLPQLLQSVSKKPESLHVLSQAVSDRLLLAFAFDPAIEALFDDAGLSGRMYMPKETTGEKQIVDFFLPVFTTTGGNKSDRYMEQQMTHESIVTDTGSVQNEVTLYQRHRWSKEQESAVRQLIRAATGQEISDEVLRILGNERNRQYVRYFVPKGSTLISVEGVDRDAVKTTEDLGLTVFGFEINTPVGAEKRVQLTYALPGTVKSGEVGYYIIMQKQPGGANIPMTKSFAPSAKAVIMADSTGYSVVQDSPENLRLDSRPQSFQLNNIWNGGYLLRVQ